MSLTGQVNDLTKGLRIQGTVLPVIIDPSISSCQSNSGNSRDPAPAAASDAIIICFRRRPAPLYQIRLQLVMQSSAVESARPADRLATQSHPAVVKRQVPRTCMQSLAVRGLIPPTLTTTIIPGGGN
eukprot:scaffold9900_cov50-Cyclotella_meneghiniana.AAC.1